MPTTANKEATRVCIQCKKRRPLTHFHRNKQSRRRMCRDCFNERRRSRRAVGLQGRRDRHWFSQFDEYKRLAAAMLTNAFEELARIEKVNKAHRIKMKACLSRGLTQAEIQRRLKLTDHQFRRLWEAHHSTAEAFLLSDSPFHRLLNLPEGKIEATLERIHQGESVLPEGLMGCV